VGWEQRARQRDASLIASRLVGLRVAIDVQHLYRESHRGDEGSVYTDAAGRHTTEAHLSTVYAIAAAGWLRERGAVVYSNDSKLGLLVGEYWTRNHQAEQWGVHAYLACHVNAGGGRYAAVEYMGGTAADRLVSSILPQLAAAMPELTGTRSVVLQRGQRGAVCIESFHGSAVILEPFFGDCPQLRPLWASDRLQRIGWAIGEGVARWWETKGRA